jgi:uncharacterized SAM-binding protein YcdF (DUF218 family)
MIGSVVLELVLVKPLHWLLKVALLLLIAAFVYWLVIFVVVWRAARSDDLRHGDAIVVLGAAQYDGRPSPVLAARLDHAAALWKAGVAPRIVVTGGKQPGDRFTEAQAGAAYLHAHGVPDAAILREVQGKSSWESLQAAARFLKVDHVVKVTLVSDPYHSARIVDIAEELGLDAVASPTRTSPVQGWAEFRLLLRESVRVAAGRLLGYGTLQRHGRIGKLVPGLAIMAWPLRRAPLPLRSPIRG